MTFEGLTMSRDRQGNRQQDRIGEQTHSLIAGKHKTLTNGQIRRVR